MDDDEHVPIFTIDEMKAVLAISDADIKAGRVVPLEDVLAMLQDSADRLIGQQEQPGVIKASRQA